MSRVYFCGFGVILCVGGWSLEVYLWFGEKSLEFEGRRVDSIGEDI